MTYIPRKWLAILVVFLAVVMLNGCTSSPIENVTPQPVPHGLTMKQIKNSIIIAGNKRDWIMTPKANGRIEATYSARGHIAMVVITYNLEEFSIKYKDSSNLGYKNGKINHNYNRWVNNLRVDIQKELSIQSMK